jgi:hypothetical protein
MFLHQRLEDTALQQLLTLGLGVRKEQFQILNGSVNISIVITSDAEDYARPYGLLWSSTRMLGHELENQVRDLVGLFVQGKMPGVEQVDFRIWKITFIRFRTRRDERGVVLAPDHEGG